MIPLTVGDLSSGSQVRNGKYSSAVSSVTLVTRFIAVNRDTLAEPAEGERLVWRCRAVVVRAWVSGLFVLPGTIEAYDKFFQ